MPEKSDKRELNRGFGDGMSRAFELAITPLVFGALGYGLDQLTGTDPVLTIALAVFGLLGMFVRTWYGYDAEMAAQESAMPWARPARRPHPSTLPADGLRWGPAPADDIWERS